MGRRPGALPLLMMVSLSASALLPFLAEATTHLDHDLHLRCDRVSDGVNGLYPVAMESNFRKGRCGAHVGMQTWYVGDLGVYTIDEGTLLVEVDETTMSPTANSDDVSPACLTGTAPGFIPGRLWPTHMNCLAPFDVTVESSLNGLAWNTVNVSRFHEWNPDGFGGSLDDPFIYLRIESGASSSPFRFLRVRLDPSLTDGQGGFLDAAYAWLNVTPAADPGWPQASHVSFTCATGILEDVIAEHPCFFGGIHKYDPADFHHTYPIGSRTLTKIAGNFTVAPYRSTINPRCANPVAGTTEVKVYAQTSTDGRNWTNETIDGSGGLSYVSTDFCHSTAFNATLSPSKQASFVRLMVELHPSFDSGGGDEVHRGYLLASDVQITTSGS